MSLGLIPRQKQLSNTQFVGDLMSLFKRYRIEPNGQGSIAQFESNLTTKDAFRSQLFTLCTAISHMAEADLSGEQLLGLIGRALDGARASDSGAVDLPASMRFAFLSGYETWSNRDLNSSDIWPPVREPAHGPAQGNEPLPFPVPAPVQEVGPRESAADEGHRPGMRTVQEALLMAKQESPFELPARAEQPARAPEPTRTPSPAAANVEGLTLNELTKLLEDIEGRMSRIKPHVNQLTAFVHPTIEPLERSGKLHEAVDAPSFEAGTTAVKREPLPVVPPPVASSTAASSPAAIDAGMVGGDSVSTSSPASEDTFLTRHAYLRARPAPVVDVTVPFSPVVVPVSILPALEVVSEPAPAPADASEGLVVEQAAPIQYARLIKSDPRAHLGVAVGLLAAACLVGIPLAGLAIYGSVHTRYYYERMERLVTPPDSGSVSAVSTSTELPVAPDGSSAAMVVGAKPGAVPSAGLPAKAGPTGHGIRKMALQPPAAVWPPPPR